MIERASCGVRQVYPGSYRGLAAAFLRCVLCSIFGEAQQGKVMPEQFVSVETYSGFKADERPLRLHLGGRVLKVAAVEDRWYSPGETFFRVVVEGGDRYVLRHLEAQDVWSLIAYRAVSGLT